MSNSRSGCRCQGQLRQRQAHRSCVQLSGESSGLLEQAVGLKPPPAEASGGGSISMGIPRTRPLGPALKTCHQVNQSQQATKNPHQPKPMRVSSQPTHSSRPRASSRPNAKFVNAVIWIKYMENCEKTHTPDLKLMTKMSRCEQFKLQYK